MDIRYLILKLNSIKSDLDAIKLWVEEKRIDTAIEYIEDNIKTLTQLKSKLKE